MNALIFGASGQDGHYLNEICKNRNIETIGVSRSSSWLKGDVSCYNHVEHLIKEHHPTYIFHLAANSTTRHDTLFENHETISTGTLNILEAVRLHSPDSRVFITGSGIQFENKGKPISETDNFEASSPYSLSRIHSVYAARYYRSFGLRIYVGYLFHHESPLRKPNHVSQKIALAVKRIEKGSKEILEMGDISVEKEWAFAGDIAEGIFTLVNQDKIFEACIGTGKVYSIKDWIEICFNRINKDWKKYVILKTSFQPEYKILISDPSKIKSLGWEPKITFENLCDLMLK